MSERLKISKEEIESLPEMSRQAQNLPPVRIRRDRRGLIVIVAGLGLLTLSLIGVSLINLLWPLFIIAPGVLLLLPAARLQPGRRPGAAYLAVVGGALATIGVLLFLQNVTGYWRSWAYAWALIPVGAMLGLRFARRYIDTERSRHNSGQVVRVMLWVFAGFAGLFELILFRDLRLWPLIVVAFGVWLIVRDRRTKENNL